MLLSEDGDVRSTAGGSPTDRWYGHGGSRPPLVRHRTQEDDHEAFDLVGAVAAKVADRLPALGFLAPNGLLDLPVDHGRIVAVHLELPSEQPLELQSIGLAADGVEDLTPLTTLTASSGHGTALDRGDLARLLDVDHPTGTLVHTEPDSPAWVALRFSRPVRLRGIRLRNVPTPTAGAARGLRVTVTARFRRVHTVYDGAADLRELDHLLGPLRAVGAVNSLLGRLLPTLEHTLRGDYPAALAAFTAMRGVDDAEGARLRAVLNAGLLASRRQTWHDPEPIGATEAGSAA
jgi:hypothetical protein